MRSRWRQRGAAWSRMQYFIPIAAANTNAA
jgi:hypothetical protein